MNITSFFLALLLLGHISSDGEYISKTELPDEKIRNLIIGTWVAPPDASDRKARGAKTEYLSDGTLLFTTYKTHKCQDVIEVLNSKWRVQAKKLILYELRDSLGNEIAPDYVVVDRIISITKEKKVLQSEEDRAIFHRIKSTQCLE